MVRKTQPNNHMQKYFRIKVANILFSIHQAESINLVFHLYSNNLALLSLHYNKLYMNVQTTF